MKLQGEKSHGRGIVTKLVKKLASHTGVQAEVLTALLPFKLSADAPGKASEDDPNAWTTAAHVEHQEGVPGSRLQQAKPWPL